jgi:hypothetical protein
MGIQLANEGVEETLITRITIINTKPEAVPLPGKYRCLFHGAASIRYGRHIFRFPIEHLGYKRLVSSFQADFAGKVRVDFGASGFDEV